MYEYRSSRARSSNRFLKSKRLLVLLLIVLVGVGSFLAYKSFGAEETVAEVVEKRLRFDASVLTGEQNKISDAISRAGIPLAGSVTARVATSNSAEEGSLIVDAYVPVVAYGSVRQKITKEGLSGFKVVIPEGTDEAVAAMLSDNLGTTVNEANLNTLTESEIAFVPITMLDSSLKLLEYEGSYFLDEFSTGAVFRIVEFEGPGASLFSSLKFDLPSEKDTYKVNMTGVTALTRIMQRKLATVGDPLYFSELIGDFLGDADYTHVSNEVSFAENCSYSDTLFCSPPEFIETLKASGVDLVEITGNHNNDRGSELNTATINQYRELGWDVVGGGLNLQEARNYVIKNEKGTKVAFLAYNFPDAPNGGAIAGQNSAGANPWDITQIEADITAASAESDFVIVNVQYWECYAYPEGYIEFPECDIPIGNQESDFKKLIDLGADMVVGSSAHQPQTYELYNGKPIYYGLGNLYFDQYQWPGTERGIVLTHYFVSGQLVQTKLTPTVYDRNLQTRLMTDAEAEYLLQRLSDAR